MTARVLSALLSAALVGSAGMHAEPLEPLKWEVISVKPMPMDACKEGEGGVRFLPNGLSAVCAPVVFIVEFAYHLMDPTRILGLPKWATGPQSYAIEARVSADDVATFSRLGREEKSGMMQSVFAERFGMRVHTETREMPAYALVLAKGGSKLHETFHAPPGASQFGGSTGEVKWVNAPLTDLKFLLAKETGRPVVDRTGLTGNYAFVLRYTPAEHAATDASGMPSIFTALEEQLGLKLLPMKQPVEVLVVDAMKEPTQN